MIDITQLKVVSNALTLDATAIPTGITAIPTGITANTTWGELEAALIQ